MRPGFAEDAFFVRAGFPRPDRVAGAFVLRTGVGVEEPVFTVGTGTHNPREAGQYEASKKEPFW